MMLLALGAASAKPGFLIHKFSPLILEHTLKKIIFIFLATLAFSISAIAAVNINTASQAQLESLPGVGPVKAKEIINYRKKNGSFKSLNDLENVNGIGPKTVKDMRKDAKISGATSISETAKKKKTDKSKKEKSDKKTKSDKTKSKKDNKKDKTKKAKKDKAKKKSDASKKAKDKKKKKSDKK